MPRLILYCTRKLEVPNIGPLAQLTEEQVATVVTQAFQKYDASSIRVVAAPVSGQNPVWKGKCQVGETECSWRLTPGLYE